MSKIFKLILSLFKWLYKILDKFIVTPISKIIYNLNKKIQKNGGKLEKILNRPNMLLYMSLIFAIVVFLLIDSKVITLVETEAEIITNQPIKVEYNSEAYVIEDLPETVDITLIGRKSDLYLAKQLGENEVVLDLTDYGARDEPYRVKLSYNQTIDSLDYKLDPTYVYVTIKKKISSLKTISYDVINQDKLNEIAPELSVSSVELSKNEVVVKGSQDTLDKIATVKALIDLNNEEFTAKGSYTLDSVPIVAYDETGNGILRFWCKGSGRRSKHRRFNIDACKGKHPFIPFKRPDIHEHIARGVRDIGYRHIAACEPVRYERVHRAEDKVPFLLRLAHDAGVIQKPAYLGSGEVGRVQKPRPPLQLGLGE